MMAVDVKRLNEADRVWIDEGGTPVNIDRAWSKSDHTIAARRLERELLAAASIDVDGMRKWFALRTLGVREIELCERLVDSRVDAVVPVRQVPVARRLGGRGKVVHKPVLGGLVFIKLVPSAAAFAGLLRVKGVWSLIGTEGRPYPIGDREMNGFMDLAQAGAFDERNTPHGLKVGSKVRIAIGPYADFHGVLEGYGRGRTARVMTWLFGCEMTVDVKLAHLAVSE